MIQNEASTMFFFVWKGLASALSGIKESAPHTSNKVNLLVDCKLFNQMVDNFQIGDPFIIEKVGIEKNILKLKLSHRGGCKSHYFDILWDGSCHDINPVQIKLIVKHHSREEMNKAYINQLLEIDLQQLMGKLYTEPIKVHVANAYDGSILN